MTSVSAVVAEWRASGSCRALGYEGLHLRFVHAFHDMALGSREFDPASLCGIGPVLEITAHGALAVIEVEAHDRRATESERDGDMHGGRRLAGAAFLLGENDAVGLLGHQEAALEYILGQSLSNPPRGGNVRIRWARLFPEWRMFTSATYLI